MSSPSQSFRTPPAGLDISTAAHAARFRALVEQDATGVIEVDVTGRFILANDRFCELTGYTQAELRQLRFQDITHPEDRRRNEELFQQLVTGSKPFGYDERYVCKNGAVVPVHLCVTPIPSADGEPRSALAVVVDMTECRRAEATARSTAERYQALFNSIDAGFCVIEMVFDEQQRAVDYVFVEVNPVFASVTGLPDVLGRRMRHLAPQHEQHWFDIYGSVALTGEPVRFEQEARALNRWFSVFAFHVGGAGSRQVAVLFEDITARKRSDQRRLFLAELATRLAPLRDDAEIIRVCVGALGSFMDVERCYFVECLEAENRVVVSENYVRGVGQPSLAGELSLFEFGGIEWWRRYAQGNFAVEDVTTNPLTAAQASAYLTRQVRSYLVQPFKQDGPWTVVLAVADSEPRAWSPDDAKLVEDVVARVWPLVQRARSDRALVAAHDALEDRVEERTARLQETVAELESFSYSLSHDLRAPLRAMQTYASILVTESGPELSADGREYLRRIMTAAERMDRLIRDVLVYSRAARADLPMERIELGSLIVGLLESYPGLSVATAEIEVVSPLGAVRANPAALTQCVANLLGNAIKFAPPGAKARVRIWSESPAPGRLRLLIRDNGIGIPPELHEKIFGMFYQIDPSREGTGIGLAVVRKSAERMGGTVGVSSTPGEGSIFWLELEDAKGGAIL